MASLLKNIAEPYNKDKVYNTKDMVLYNNLLYLCIYNNVSGEFNSSKWIEVQLTDLVQGKLRGIEDYSGKVIDASYVEQDDDYTYFGVPQKAFVDNETSFRTLNSNLVQKYTINERYTGSTNVKSLFALSSVCGNYKNIDIDDMVIQLNNVNFSGNSGITWGYSYNAETGIITVDSNQTGLLCYPSSITVCIAK